MKKSLKGIVLAGGSGTRLYPLTKVISKQLLPIYDKPMIYYSLSVLMLAGIQEILLISTPHDIDQYKRLLGDGTDYGISIEYGVQNRPSGIAEAFIIGESFIGNSDVSLILGDNIFYGSLFGEDLKKISNSIEGAIVFGYKVNDPERYGVIEFDENLNVISIEEKPSSPKSDYAVTGLYFYDNDVVNIAKSLKPSERGELEITDVNKAYLRKNKLNVKPLGRGYSWLDSGTFDSLVAANNLIKVIQEQQSYNVGCIEEIAFSNGWISKEDILRNSKNYKGSSYYVYLQKLINNL